MKSRNVYVGSILLGWGFPLVFVAIVSAIDVSVYKRESEDKAKQM